MIILNCGNCGVKGVPKISDSNLQWDNNRKVYFRVSYCTNGKEIISKTTSYHNPSDVTLSSKINCWFKRIFNKGGNE